MPCRSMHHVGRMVMGNWRISREISGIDSSVKIEPELPPRTIDVAARGCSQMAGALVHAVHALRPSRPRGRRNPV